MADGAPRFFGNKKRSMMAYAQEADPRFSNKAEQKPAKKLFRGKPKERPRIAFTGEEYGFGFQATGHFLKRAREDGTVADGGVSRTGARTEREYDEASKNSRFDYHNDIPQPLRTKEQALMAVKQLTADFAVVPFYNPYAGYDFETLRALSSLFSVIGVEQVEATDNLCLAVHESQLYDIIQSSHPGAGFSALQRRMRKSWGATDNGSGNEPGDASYDGEMPRAGLPLDMSDQKLIRDRIDHVFAGPEATRRCKSKLDGLRAIGVDVQETAQMIEPHRELARLARGTASGSRQTNTFFDASSGEMKISSSMSSESQSTPLFGMVLPYEVAMRSSDYHIIDHNFDDGPAEKARFLVVENNPDHSLFEDKYRTTDARTAYWMRRLNAVAGSDMSVGAGLMKFFGLTAATLAIALVTLGFYGAANINELVGAAALSWLPTMTATTAIIAGGVVGLIAYFMLSVQGRGEKGVRVMLRFKRDGTAASIGDVENFLRNYGIRHAVVRMDEDSEKRAPAAVVLDVEFDPEDFSYGPFAALSRRLRGSVANGAMKKAFQRWKNRGVTVLAAVPFEAGEGQLPKHKPRRWWSEAVGDWLSDVVETAFIRFTRVAVFYLIPAAVVIYFVWKLLLNG